MNRFLIALAMGMLVFGVAAQQPTNDQVQDLSIQLNLTQQQLTEANKNFVNERSSTIRLGRQLNEALAEAVKKDGQIKDLTAKVAAAAKPPEPPKGNVEPEPSAPINAGPARP